MNTYAVWKYPVRIEDYFEIEMPKGAKILYVATQSESAWLWALCDTGETAAEVRRFRLAGTGHSIQCGFFSQQPTYHHRPTYLGSFQLHGGALVFHLFERGPEDTEDKKEGAK